MPVIEVAETFMARAMTVGTDWKIGLRAHKASFCFHGGVHRGQAVSQVKPEVCSMMLHVQRGRLHSKIDFIDL